MSNPHLTRTQRRIYSRTVKASAQRMADAVLVNQSTHQGALFGMLNSQPWVRRVKAAIRLALGRLR